MSPTFRALSNRNYRLYAAGGVVSNIGTWMQRIAQDWLVLQLTGIHSGAQHSGVALGVTTGLQFLPILLLSPYAGLIADQFSKRRLLQLTQLMMAVPAAVLGVLAISGAAEVWQVFVIAFVFGIGRAFDVPARQAFVSEMVGPDDITNAVGLNSASFNMARIVGPALAGGMIALMGSDVRATGLVILINAVSYSAVIYALRRMRPEELYIAERAARKPGMVRAGIAYVRGRSDLMLILTIIFFAGTFGFNFQMTSALMATGVYHKGAGEYGLLGTTMAVGSLAGALYAARRRGRPRHRLVIGAAVAFGIAEVIAGVMPSYLTFAVATPLIGLTALTLSTAANATVQLSVSPMMRGRVMALYMTIFMGGTPLGAPVIGWVGQTFGARWTLIGGGAGTVAGTVLAVALFSWAQGLIGPRRKHQEHDQGPGPGHDPEPGPGDGSGEVMARAA